MTKIIRRSFKKNTQDKLPERFDRTGRLVDRRLAGIYGRRFSEYRRLYKAAGEFKHEPKFPLYLMLEQTYSCNLRCPSCIHGYPELKKRFNLKEKRMSWEIFAKVVKEGGRNGCPSIIFNVNDEPLLVNDLPKRVAFARDRGFMDLFITTNGNLLDEKRALDLIENGITRILFSIDAATPRTYKKVRPGGDFARVVKNIKFISDYKKRHKLILPALRASFVASRLNVGEKAAFVRKFSPLVDYVEIQEFSAYYSHNMCLVPEKAKHTRDFSCTEPWRKLIIRANGDVLPCCTFYGYEIVIGNVLKRSLREIFNSTFCRLLRSEFKNGIYRLAPCSACADSFYRGF